MATYDAWVDVHHPALLVQVDAEGRTISDELDGKGAWSIDGQGAVAVDDSAEATSKARLVRHVATYDFDPVSPERLARPLR